MKPRIIPDIEKFIFSRNARTMRQAECAANVLVALVLGVAGSLALLHWCGWLV